jgi:hypothetical protein
MADCTSRQAHRRYFLPTPSSVIKSSLALPPGNWVTSSAAQCGRYKSATITYSNGAAKTLNLGNAPATKTDMDQAKAAIPVLQIVDVAGCD